MFSSNFHEFYEGQLICYSFILLIVIRQYQFFPNFDSPIAFFPKSIDPRSQLQNGRNIPDVSAFAVHPLYVSERKSIGVAPITQLRTCVIKMITIEGGHLMW